MTKQTFHKLTLYRRHASSCPAKDSDKLDSEGCNCPFWVHGKLHGKFTRQSLDTRKLDVASNKKDALLNRGGDDDTPGGLSLVSNPNVTVEAAAKEFLASKGRKATSTKKLYTRTVGLFRRWAEAHSLTLLRQIDTPDVRKFFTEYDGNWGGGYSQNHLVRLRIFFKFCMKRRWIQWSPAADSDLNYTSGKSTKKRLPFTPAEITQILLAVEQMPAETRDRARALVLLLLYTGMRISDATFFEREYLTEENFANYWVIKTRRWISLPPEVHQRAVDALMALPQSRVYFFQADRDDNYEAPRNAREGDKKEFSLLMPDYTGRVAEATRIVLKVLALAGNTKGACHRFRDTFAINLLSADVDIYTISQMLGHSDVRITQDHYLNGKTASYQATMSQKTRSLAYTFPAVAA